MGGVDYEEELLRYLVNLGNITPLTSGNISVIDLARGLVFIKPSGMRGDEIKKEDISVVDMNGVVIGGKKPSVDLPIHLEIYKKNPGAKSIVHTHSHFATVASCIYDEIPINTTLHADYIKNSIPVLKENNFRKDLSKAAANLIYESKSPAILMSNHGLFAIGSSCGEAFKTAVACEEVCRLHFFMSLIAGATGRTIRKIPEEVVSAHIDRFKHEYGQEIIKGS